MKIISHNSHTYLPPTKWWMKAINFTARCQTKSLQEQYEAGVRFFDIRVRFNTFCDLKYVHGVIEYKSDIDIFQFLNDKGDCTLRVMLDDRNGCDPEEQTQQLTAYMDRRRQELKNLNLIDIYRLSDSKCVINYNNPMPTVDGQYASASSCKIVGVYPKLWHKLHKYTVPDCEYLMRDFI